jgi:hypothetical protein
MERFSKWEEEEVTEAFKQFEREEHWFMSLFKRTRNYLDSVALYKSKEALDEISKTPPGGKSPYMDELTVIKQKYLEIKDTYLNQSFFNQVTHSFKVFDIPELKEYRNTLEILLAISHFYPPVLY